MFTKKPLNDVHSGSIAAVIVRSILKCAVSLLGASRRSGRLGAALHFFIHGRGVLLCHRVLRDLLASGCAYIINGLPE